MNTIQQALNDSLRFDPLAAAELVTGESYRSSDNTIRLGMVIAQDHGKEKSGLLALNQDTDDSAQTYKEWERVAFDIGFEKVLELPIAETGDFFRVYWADGLLLVTDSYWKDKSVNSAKCYFNFRATSEDAYKARSGCSHGGVPEGETMDASYDSRQGLRLKLAQLRECGEIPAKWVRRPFMWLLHYMDTKTEGYDYEVITESRIAMLPEHVRSAITP